MSDILVVGSVGYDSIKTPYGHEDHILGGSANYFSLAASHYTQVRVVGVVGEDYEESDMEMLRQRGVDLAGMNRVKGKTFFWSGEYKKDMNEAITHKTELNVFENFDPVLPENYKNSKFIFLANIDPDLQLKVLDQVKNPVLKACDTMNLWINIKLESLKKVLKRVDLLLINEGEARLLAQTHNTAQAAEIISSMGPKQIVIKRGEYGVMLYTPEGYFVLPAFPLNKVVDPTGAGDTFAGGFFGYIAKNNTKPDAAILRQACVHGTIMASHTIQGFGVTRLRDTTWAEVEKKQKEFLKLLAI